MQSSPFRRRLSGVLRAVGLRVLLWGGLALAAVLYFVDLRALLPNASTPTPEEGPIQAAADDGPGWPHLRGPHYNGQSDETDLAESWPSEGPPLLWNLEIGRGYSACVAVGDRVFTQRQTLAEQSVLCLNAANGAVIWEHRYGWPYESGGMYPGPRATPTIRDGFLYFAAPDGLVGCLRAADGRSVWSLNVLEKFKGQGVDFGYACSPLVEEGKVVLPVGGPGAAVVALDARDGSTAWASGSEPASYCSAVPIELGGRRIVVAFLQNVLAGFDLRTGRVLWEQPYSRGYDEHAAIPLYDEPLLLAMLPFRAGSDLYELSPSAGDEGPAGIRLVRHGKEMSNDTASSVMTGGYVYGFDLREPQTNRHRPSRGEFKCIEFRSGKVRWTSDRPGHATIALADGKLFLLNDKGELILARASPDRYEELARTEVFRGEICWTAPTLHRGRLFLRSPTRAACVYVGRPERLAEEERARAAPAASRLPPRSWDLSWLVGGEREFPYDAPDLRELGRWYLFSLAGVFAVATAAAAGLAGLARARGSNRASAIGRAAFWLLVLVLGVAATPLGNRVWGEFVFTWPAGLFAAQQLTLAAIARAGQQPDRPGARRISIAAVVFLLVVCLAYYDLCRRQTLAINWVFLIGFLPSWPLAIPAARSLVRPRHAAIDLLWTLLAFSLFFWASAGFLFLHTWFRLGAS